MIKLRPAAPEDLETLNRLQRHAGNELIDLRRAVVFVAEIEGKIEGFVAGRLMFQVEPLWVSPALNNPTTRRRVTLGLARAIEGWLKRQPYPWARNYFAYIRDAVFQRLAEAYGLRPIYGHGKFYLREGL